MNLDRDCVLECGPDKTCFPDTCCGNKKANSKEPENSTADNVRQRQNGSTGSHTSLNNGCADHKNCSLTDVVTEAEKC